MLILASGSKARKRLLEQAHIEYVPITSNVNEQKFNNKNPYELSLLLAKEKSLAVFNKITKTNQPFYHSAKAILGCDSIFELKNSIYGKPNTEDEVLARWKIMSGGSGLLHTGHYLFYLEDKDKSKYQLNTPYQIKGQISKVITSKIHFEKINHKEIQEYLLSGEPFQCAGGFSIDGKGSVFVKSVEGCYSNILGLSLPWIRKVYLRHFDI